MSLPTLFAAPAVLVVLVWAGQAVAGRLPGTRPHRLVVGFLGGGLLLHAELSLLDVAGWRWGLSLFLPLVVLGFVGRPHQPCRPTAPLGWGDMAALVAVLPFAALAWTGWIAIPDFVYHWGLKGHRFLIAGHVDYAYLAQPLGWVFHPDYPSFYPELLAVTGLLGGWREPGLLLWSPLMLLLMVLAVRELLVAEGVPAFRRHAVTSFVALACAGFGIAHLMAGAADWLMSLVLVAALPALLSPPSRTSSVELGLCAALAAAAKQEGAVLALALVTVQLARGLWRRQRPGSGDLAALLGPPALVLGYSLARVAQYQLLQRYDKRPPTLDGVRSTLVAVAEQLVAPAWHGMALLLLATPLLLVLPRLRPLLAVTGLQLAAYVASCAGQGEGIPLLVVTTFTRFVLQLLPALVAAAAVGLFGAAPLFAGATPRAGTAPAGA